MRFAFSRKKMIFFPTQIFPVNYSWAIPPEDLYEVNFIRACRAQIGTHLSILIVENLLLETLFNMNHPQFMWHNPLKKNRFTKNCTSDLFILR